MFKLPQTCIHGPAMFASAKRAARALLVALLPSAKTPGELCPLRMVPPSVSRIMSGTRREFEPV